MPAEGFEWRVSNFNHIKYISLILHLLFGYFNLIVSNGQCINFEWMLAYKFLNLNVFNCLPFLDPQNNFRCGVVVIPTA